METEIADEIVKAGFFVNGNLWDFVIRYGINLLMIVTLVRFIYYPRHKNKDFFFTFFVFNTVDFIICFLLSSLKLKIGFAFGLFAIFSIMRYRTISVAIREMGYLFISVTLGIINALADINGSLNALLGYPAANTAHGPDHSFYVLIIANVAIVAMAFILDRSMGLDHENMREIIYERIDLVKPEVRNLLLEDLRNRTGLPVHRVEIVKFDFLRDIARVKAYYYSRDNETSINLNDTDDDD